MRISLNAVVGIVAAVLAVAVLHSCPGDDGDSTYKCSRQGRPAYHTPSGQRCYPDK